MSFLSFEACRRWQVFDYKSLLKKLLGRWWFVYEITYIPLVILIIAVMASAAGEILSETLGFPTWGGVLLIIVLVGFLNYMGETFISIMKTWGTLALFAAYTAFGLLVFTKYNEEISHTLFTAQSGDQPGVLPLVWTGIIYVGYNLAVFPASFFTLKKFETTSQSLIAGTAAGLLMTIPWFLTFFAIMAFYPSAEVMDAPVPWLRMLQGFGPYLIVVFGVVVGWTLVETATGTIHAFIIRLNEDVKQSRGRSLKSWHKAGISFIALGLALVLSRVGIIDLIAKGYSFMAIGMILFFAVPLLYHGFKFIITR